jgi:hypothetical protein
MLDLVDHPGSLLSRPMPCGGQATIREILVGNDTDSPHPLDPLAGQQAMPVHPQQLTELVRIPAIRFLLRRFSWMDQNHLATSVLVQNLDQPFVKPANLQDGGKSALRLALTLKLLEELHDFFRIGADLASQQDSTVFVAQGNR